MAFSWGKILGDSGTSSNSSQESVLNQTVQPSSNERIGSSPYHRSLSKVESGSRLHDLAIRIVNNPSFNEEVEGIKDLASQRIEYPCPLSMSDDDNEEAEGSDRLFETIFFGLRDRESPEALMGLATHYLEKPDERSWVKRGIYWLYQALEKGHKDAPQILGNIYKNGLYHQPKNYQKAAEYFGWHDDPASMYDLALMYEKGLIGAGPDYKKAIMLLQKVVRLGDHTVILSLAKLHIQGKCDDIPSLKKTIELLERVKKRIISKGQSGEQKLRDIYFALGILYSNEHSSTVRDDNKAKMYFEEGYKLGDVSSTFQLGCIYCKNGMVGDQLHFARGVFLLSEAADKGHEEAKTLLAQLHQKFNTPTSKEVPDVVSSSSVPSTNSPDANHEVDEQKRFSDRLSEFWETFDKKRKEVDDKFSEIENAINANLSKLIDEIASWTEPQPAGGRVITSFQQIREEATKALQKETSLFLTKCEEENKSALESLNKLEGKIPKSAEGVSKRKRRNIIKSITKDDSFRFSAQYCKELEQLEKKALEALSRIRDDFSKKWNLEMVRHQTRETLSETFTTSKQQRQSQGVFAEAESLQQHLNHIEERVSDYRHRIHTIMEQVDDNAEKLLSGLMQEASTHQTENDLSTLNKRLKKGLRKQGKEASTALSKVLDQAHQEEFGWAPLCTIQGDQDHHLLESSDGEGALSASYEMREKEIEIEELREQLARAKQKNKQRKAEIRELETYNNELKAKIPVTKSEIQVSRKNLPELYDKICVNCSQEIIEKMAHVMQLLAGVHNHKSCTQTQMTNLLSAAGFEGRGGKGMHDNWAYKVKGSILAGTTNTFSSHNPNTTIKPEEYKKALNSLAVVFAYLVKCAEKEQGSSSS